MVISCYVIRLKLVLYKKKVLLGMESMIKVYTYGQMTSRQFVDLDRRKRWHTRQYTFNLICFMRRIRHIELKQIELLNIPKSVHSFSCDFHPLCRTWVEDSKDNYVMVPDKTDLGVHVDFSKMSVQEGSCPMALKGRDNKLTTYWLVSLPYEKTECFLL